MEGIPIVVPVRFAVGGLVKQTTSGWLSLQAVFVRCLEAPSKGAVIALRIALPGRVAPEQVEGVVGECVPPGARGEAGFWAGFRKLPIASRRRVARFLGGRNAALSALSRRAFPRALLCREVLVRRESGSFVAHSENVSRGGMFIAGSTLATLHEMLEVQLNLPDGMGAVRTKAEVVQRVLPHQAHGSRAGAGLQFVGADDAFRERLDSCLDNLLATPLMTG
jgi:hypothetical protein